MAPAAEFCRLKKRTPVHAAVRCIAGTGTRHSCVPLWRSETLPFAEVTSGAAISPRSQSLRFADMPLALNTCPLEVMTLFGERRVTPHARGRIVGIVTKQLADQARREGF